MIQGREYEGRERRGCSKGSCRGDRAETWERVLKEGEVKAGVMGDVKDVYFRQVKQEGRKEPRCR